ncbi:MAG TPA: hypothetical protein VFS20_01700 [Longimicrobium sp.]|nr:hypothetical protein [Longimicrobium sp.]
MHLNRYAAFRAAALIVCAAVATPAAAQVQVTLRPLAPVEAFFVADLVPGNPGVRPDLVGITLVPARAGQTVSLEIIVARESPSPVEIFRGTTSPFVLGQAVRHLTTRDLTSRGRDVSITDYTVNEDALQGPARSGRLPAGTYLITVRVHTGGGEPVDDDELRLTLTTPSRVELLSPGAPADMTPPVVPGPTPRFIWSAEGEGAAARYRLRVVQVDPAAGSAVEALQAGFPAWETTTAATSAFYPASVEALRLEPGATYAWQVTRELRSSGGTEVIESPIYWFRVGGAGGPSPAAGTLGLRFAELLRALGITDLNGFIPESARLEDGRPVPLDVLEQLLAAIVAGEVAVLNVRVR